MKRCVHPLGELLQSEWEILTVSVCSQIKIYQSMDMMENYNALNLSRLCVLSEGAQNSAMEMESVWMENAFVMKITVDNPVLSCLLRVLQVKPHCS